MTGTFPLGSIPPLSVWEGETLNFKVTSKRQVRYRSTKSQACLLMLRDPSPSLVLDLTDRSDYTVEPRYSDLLPP